MTPTGQKEIRTPITHATILQETYPYVVAASKRGEFSSLSVVNYFPRRGQILPPTVEGMRKQTENEHSLELNTDASGSLLCLYSNQHTHVSHDSSYVSIVVTLYWNKRMRVVVNETVTENQSCVKSF